MQNKSNVIVTVLVMALLVASFALYQSAEAKKGQLETVQKMIKDSEKRGSEIKDVQVEKVKQLPSEYKAMNVAVQNLITKENHLTKLTWKNGVYQANIVKSEKYTNIQKSIENDFTDDVDSDLLNKPFNNNPKWTAKILEMAETSVNSIPVMIGYYNEKDEFVKGVELVYSVNNKQFESLNFVYTATGNLTENEEYFNTPQGKVKQDEDDVKVGEE